MVILKNPNIYSKLRIPSEYLTLGLISRILKKLTINPKRTNCGSDITHPKVIIDNIIKSKGQSSFELKASQFLIEANIVATTIDSPVLNISVPICIGILNKGKTKKGENRAKGINPLV
jgi:hypothetical protein